MPYQPPNPRKKGQSGMSGMIGAWVQAEKMIQIALVLPCAALIGWALGLWLDHMLHLKWIATAGIIFGIVAGLIGAIQMAVAFSSGPRGKGQSGDSTENGDSNKTS